MAITGIDTLDGKQIIAAGASSAISAQQALQTSGGNDLQSFYDAVSTNSASWVNPQNYVYTNTANFNTASRNNIISLGVDTAKVFNGIGGCTGVLICKPLGTTSCYDVDLTLMITPTAKKSDWSNYTGFITVNNGKFILPGFSWFSFPWHFESHKSIYGAVTQYDVTSKSIDFVQLQPDSSYTANTFFVQFHNIWSAT